MPFQIKQNDAYTISLFTAFFGLVGWIIWNLFTSR